MHEFGYCKFRKIESIRRLCLAHLIKISFQRVDGDCAQCHTTLIGRSSQPIAFDHLALPLIYLSFLYQIYKTLRLLWLNLVVSIILFLRELNFRRAVVLIQTDSLRDGLLASIDLILDRLGA